MIDRQLFVIFGGSGDLTRRKLLPSLYRLIAENQFGHRCIVLSVGTGEGDDGSYRRWARDALGDAGVTGEQLADWCDTCVHYQPISGDPDSYRVLRNRIEELELELGLPGNRVFYLALPPRVFPIAIAELGEAGLNRSPGWTRVVIEKPYGRDLASAQELNRVVHRHFDESQVYRIDHYLGKATVQNLLIFRFANDLFESSWSRDRVKNVQILVAEDLGVEGRADYYDRAGAVRDMVQNHLTQVLTLVAMEPPSSLDAEQIRDEKVKVIRAIAPLDPEDVVLSQYTAGTIHGLEVPGYREEPGVPPDSTSETGAALRLWINNWRWQGVPFYVRTGKRLPERLTQIVVTFREPPVRLFHMGETCDTNSNVLVIRLQPDEGFELFIDVKSPADGLKLERLPLDFRYEHAFGPMPSAYQTLIQDVLMGDQTLFVRADEAEAAWELYDPIIENHSAVLPYAAGSRGTEAARQLVQREGNAWWWGNSPEVLSASG